jgi:hypothetical protein
VGRALLVRGFAALAGDLALLRAVHRSESAILFSHTYLLPSNSLPARMRASAFVQWGCNAGATAQVVILVTLSNKGTYLHIFPQVARSGVSADERADSAIREIC